MKQEEEIRHVAWSIVRLDGTEQQSGLFDEDAIVMLG